ncbi:hypothetical protein RN001_001405 [Aquatica leii]|uniref:Uncharacterized protein n=1 Tax=Aquatica leii TaxID=1421715 RepID=A0AAN7SL76_9COLE|nr:hypothetical protein RN001_001405 [Aquatica leii]
MLKTLVIVFLIWSSVHCDWVEIPQNIKDDKFSKKSDFTLFVLTTSSTTQTSLLNKFSHARLKNDFNKTNITTETTETSILTTEVLKKDILPRTTLKPVNKRNFTKGLVFKIQKQNEGTEESFLSNNNFQRRSSTNDFVEAADDENFIDNKDSYSYTSFIPFLSKIQGVLMKNAHKNKKSKLNVLSGLRDHLLYEIESRISYLWKPTSHARESRDYKDDSHMNFPSNESALITIGFLTFAVFLIKLVMQLMNAISAHSTTTMVVGRKRREPLNDDVLRILNHIEQYTLK